MKEIKTKQALKDIKVLDKTSDVSRRTKNAYIRTKEQAEQHGHNEDGNYVGEAANSVRESTETAVREAGHTAKNYGKKAVEKIQERRVPDADAPRSETSNGEYTQQTPKREVKEIVRRDVARTETKLAREQNATSVKAKEAATQTLYTSGKTGRTIKWSAGTDGKTVRKAVKGTIKKAQKSVKTAEYTAKATIKTSQVVVKTTAKTAQTTQRAAQAARAAARVATVTTKTAAKAIAVTIKAIIAAVKGLTAIIAVGGWIAVVVILVICLTGFLLGSGFGIFFSNESSGENTPVITEVVSQLNEEFTAEIQRIQDEKPHDSLELSGNESSTIGNWREILAVYAVKAAADPENGMEVVTLDDVQVGILREVFWDMNEINYRLETIEHKEIVTTTDKDGNEIKKTVTTTETILHINVTSKSYLDMIAEYGFDAEQVNMLNELMQDKYQQLFMQLTGN